MQNLIPVLSSIVLSVLFVVTLGFAFHYYGKNPTYSLWWGVASGILVVIGIGLLIQQFVITPTKENRDAFNIEVVSRMGSDKRLPGVGFTVLAYQSKRGNTLSPIHRMYCLRITNNQPLKSMIETYRVEAQVLSGEWKRLIWINPNRGSVYFIANGGGVLSELPSFDSIISDRALMPKQTVEGWVFFELPEDIPLEQPIRVYVKDFDGAEATKIFNLNQIQDFGQNVKLHLRGGVVDLSTFTNVGYYSEMTQY